MKYAIIIPDGCADEPQAVLGGKTPLQAAHKPIAEHLPRGPGSGLLQDLMQQSRDVLRDHPVNRAREARGEKPATQVWLWGQGRAPRLRPFAEVFGKQGAILSA